MSDLADRLEAVVRCGLPGVAFAGGGEEAAAGLANVVKDEAMTPDHRFQIGSVMKTFVATVVLQLVDEGALELDGDSRVVEGVTVRQLLNHTSGLPDFIEDMVALFEPYRADPGHRWQLGPYEMLTLDRQKPRLFPPGQGWAYRSANYLALGLLVEETTGSTLPDELQRRIFGPLGLGGTEVRRRGDSPAGLARGYFPADNPVLPGPGPGPVDGTDLDLPFNWLGGGIVSRPRDVARFLQALLGGELLPERLRAEMLTTVPSDWDETDGYGLGIGTISSLMRKADSPCGRAWGHIGFSSGYTTIALSSESGDRQAVIMANGFVPSDEGWEAVGRLAWSAYCH